MSILKLRDASEDDATIISQLIYCTEESPEHVWGEGTKAEILNRIQQLIKSQNSRYSYTNIKIAELEGNACGVIILLESKNISKLDILTSIKMLSLIKGIIGKLKFIKDIIIGSRLEEVGENEFYIANLAITEEVRGKGIGKELMKVAEEIAKKKGYNKCSLLAKDKNVKIFYERLNYKLDKEEIYFSHSLYRMIKAV